MERAPLDAPDAGAPRPLKITADMLDEGRRAPAPVYHPASDGTAAHAASRADGRVDFERGMSYAPRLTLALIAINVLVFAWQVSGGALDSEASLVAFGALVRDRLLQGQMWRLVSAAFLHGSVAHLAGNMVALYILGMAVEHAVGRDGTARIYFGAAIGGTLLSALAHPGPSVGASGAIFGMLGATIVVLHQHRDRLHVRDARIGYVLGAWALQAFVSGMLDPVVDNAAHLGGLVVGASLAWATPLRAGLLRGVDPAPRGF